MLVMNMTPAMQASIRKTIRYDASAYSNEADVRNFFFWEKYCQNQGFWIKLGKMSSTSILRQSVADSTESKKLNPSPSVI